MGSIVIIAVVAVVTMTLLTAGVSVANPDLLADLETAVKGMQQDQRAIKNDIREMESRLKELESRLATDDEKPAVTKPDERTYPDLDLIIDTSLRPGEVRILVDRVLLEADDGVRQKLDTMEQNREFAWAAWSLVRSSMSNVQTDLQILAYYCLEHTCPKEAMLKTKKQLDRVENSLYTTCVTIGEQEADTPDSVERMCQNSTDMIFMRSGEIYSALYERYGD